jgi:hypothetical protein
MATADATAGLAGVAVLAGLLFTLSVWLVLGIARSGEAGEAPAIMAACVSMMLLLVHLLPRPHLFTTALLGVETLLLVRFRKSGDWKLLLLLPVLFAAWANLHGGFPIGFVVLALFVADAIYGALRRETDWQGALLLSATAAVGLLGTLANPVGIGLWAHVTEHLGNRFFMDITQEFQSPDFHQPYGRMFLAVILAAAILVAAGRPRIRRIEGGLFLLGLAAALTSARHITVFAIISVPWMAVWASRALADAAEAGSAIPASLLEKGRRFASTASTTGPFLPLIAGILAIALAVGSWSKRASFDPSQFPVAALRAIPPGSLPPELFNQMRWGGYILYEYPEIRIFMDGHADFFGEALTREYLGIRHLAPGWQESLDRYDVNWTLTMPMAPLTQALDLSPDWRRAYADPTAVIFVRQTSEQGRSPDRD